MNYAIYRAAETYAADLKKYNIKVDAEACIIITRDKAIRLPADMKTDKANRAIREVVDQAKTAAKTKLEAKQSRLF